jgi:hypothetical protein
VQRLGCCSHQSGQHASSRPLLYRRYCPCLKRKKRV